MNIVSYPHRHILLGPQGWWRSPHDKSRCILRLYSGIPARMVAEGSDTRWYLEDTHTPTLRWIFGFEMESIYCFNIFFPFGKETLVKKNNFKLI